MLKNNGKRACAFLLAFVLLLPSAFAAEELTEQPAASTESSTTTTSEITDSPETTASETTLPETTPSETTTPETTTPETTPSETTTTETTVPNTTPSDTAVPGPAEEENVLPLAEEEAPVLLSDDDPPLVQDGSVELGVDYAVNAEYPWSYSSARSSTGYNAYIAGNSGTKTQNVSNLAVTVHQAGVINFDWKTNTGSGSYGLRYRWGDPVTTENQGTCVGSLNGATGWKPVSVSVTEDMLTSGEAILYIAYVRGGSSVTGDNYGVIANLSQEDGMRTLNVITEGEEYGTITGGEATYMTGSTVTLTAAPSASNRFYGWVKDGVFAGTDLKYAFTISENTTVQGVFAPNETYLARKNGEFFSDETSLADIVNGMAQNDIVELLKSAELTENATVPVGGTLYLPYSAAWDSQGHKNGGNTALAGVDKAYVTMTVLENVTLTVNGTLRLGSVISCTGHDMQGHTSGAHGRIDCSGTISVSGGGILDSWGIITGSGDVSISSNGLLYEPFMVNDFSGGSNTQDLYLSKTAADGTASPAQTPFKRYALQNVQARLTLLSGGELYGHCNLYAMGDYNMTDAPIVASGGLYAPVPGATVVRTYDPNKTVTGSSALTGVNGVGHTTWTVTGGMKFQALKMNVMGFLISTDSVDFPIPYNMSFVLNDGVYTVVNRLKLMPGAEMTVNEDATLNVNEDFYVLDGLRQERMSSKIYPSSAALTAAGYSASGMLTVNGTMNVAADVAFGGIVQTTGSTGKIVIADGAELVNAVVQDGGIGCYSDNTSRFALPARVNIGGTLTPLTVGTYSAVGNTAFMLADYTMTYCSNGGTINTDTCDYKVSGRKWATETVTINQAMTGAWTAH